MAPVPGCQQHIDRFVKIGLSEQKAEETLKNVVLSNKLIDAIDQAEKCSNGSFTKQTGMMLYHLATDIKPQIQDKLPILVKYVCEEKLDSKLRLTAALEYLLSHPSDDVDMTAFEKASGIGVIVTPEEIEKVVENVIGKHKEGLVKDRYRYNVGKILADARGILKWGDGKCIKHEVDIQVMMILGPKTDLDNEKPSKKPAKKKTASSNKDENVLKKDEAAATEDKSMTMSELLKTRVNFHKPGENFKTDGYVVTPKTMELMKEHLNFTGGQVRSRFPPEPNGILHIGHAKAINVNFGYAAAHDGICFLRYDDTNPEKEEEKFFIGIKEMVNWLGYTPYKITHSSDYFDELYELAKVLIKKDLAYVCHQKAEDMKGFNPPPSPYRNRSIEENFQLFQDMKYGKFDEGEATLRMKHKLEEGKADPVCYRIKYSPHHRTGTKWCIYPTYDFTHCLCDSLEHITHSLCTKEFQSRRSSYYWLCNAVDIYCPVQWEYGRLNVNYTVVSKRKIAKLITSGIVRDWDDPRLFTLTALRRRGFPHEAINNFCAQVGLTMAKVSIDPQMLEACVRDHLNISAPRKMAVLDPVKVRIENLSSCMESEDTVFNIEVPDFPNDPSLGKHTVPLSDVLYIERNDFMESEVKGYRRLTTNQPVGLKHAGLVISVTNIVKDDAGNIQELTVRAVKVNKETKPKAFIHWVSNGINCEIRLYDRLFFHKNPEDANEVPGGFLSDCNQDSLTVLKEALVDVSVKDSKVYDKFQFERVGFFSVDPDTTDKKIVFNRTVLLKEDSSLNRGDQQQPS